MTIQPVEPVGNDSVKLVFRDGHDTGLYAWDYLCSLGVDHDTLWKTYLERFDKAGASGDA